MWLDDEELGLRFVLHDNDSKFSAGFDAVFDVAGALIVRTPFLSPIANAFAESWIATLKRECHNHFFCFSHRHLDHIVQTCAGYYNTVRPHQPQGHNPIGQGSRPPPVDVTDQDVGPVRRRTYLTGLFSHYERRAA